MLRSNPIRPDSRVEKEAACLVENGFKVIIISWDRDNNYREQHGSISSFGFDIPIIWLGYKAQFGAGMESLKPFLQFQSALYRWLKNNLDQYDIIHACDYDTAFVAFLIKRKYGKKLVFDIFDFRHGDPKTLIQRLIRGIQNRIINQADATIICTEERKQQIRDSHPKKLVVIHNTPPKVDYEQNLDSNTNNKVKVCYVGILQDWRLLEEIPNFFIENQDVEFHIGGFGKFESLYEELSNKYPNIIFYGRLPYDQTLKLEASCDIILAIYAPLRENHKFAAPNKFYESLMLAKPVVMVKQTGMSSIVDRYDIGVTIEYSLLGFAKGINYLINRRCEWSNMAQTMTMIYNTQFSWDEMKHRLVDLYSSLS